MNPARWEPRLCPDPLPCHQYIVMVSKKCCFSWMMLFVSWLIGIWPIGGTQMWQDSAAWTQLSNYLSNKTDVRRWLVDFHVFCVKISSVWGLHGQFWMLGDPWGGSFRAWLVKMVTPCKTELGSNHFIIWWGAERLKNNLAVLSALKNNLAQVVEKLVLWYVAKKLILPQPWKFNTKSDLQFFVKKKNLASNGVWKKIQL